MTIFGLLAVSLLWAITWFANQGVLMATGMMTDSAGEDNIETFLIVMAFMISGAYFFIVPGAVLVAWVAFLVNNIPVAQTALLVPVIHIGVYFISMCLICIRQPRWIGLQNNRLDSE